MADIREKRLFTPGPLNCSPAVLGAMNRNMGSREPEFLAIIRQIRTQLLEEAVPGSEDHFEAIPMQGSGTFGIEACLGTLIPASGRLLVLVNGSYGARIATIAERLGIPVTILACPETELHDLELVERCLDTHPEISHLAAVHLETTTGIVNPIDHIARIARARRKILIVDGMSSFGALPLDLGSAGIDCLVSSPNKCLEGVPGFSFVIVRRTLLESSRGVARSVSLDLFDQWTQLEQNGQFRFTPPTHALLAFHAALQEFRAEGGTEGRALRYRENHLVLREGMKALGFRPLLSPELQGNVISAFHTPSTTPAFDFEVFYQELADRQFIIYPGKVTDIDSFRIGNIGHLFPEDFRALLEQIERILMQMGHDLPLATEGH